MLSPLELVVVAGVVALVFGPKKLPELGKGLGEAISNFKRSYKSSEAIDVTPPKEEKKEDLKSDIDPKTS